ncbi:DUF3367 domain-containing protein [Corynebacterium cystitidis]|uniref:DUF3367 domain-containing protein n=1 Tax=Corynebacterium cystitidis TaxID=35757 RepID=UPI00211E7B13|nr:DUF3367 domain-containing protein [Corynebacterium cystitidis]
MAHVVGWIILTLLAFLQDPGRTAADTKLDLSLDPAGFLARATSAYTDEFTLGQIQNQASGYLFPQGLFFVLTEPLPDWVAQRLWWAVVMGVAYSGTLILTRRLGFQGRVTTITPAVLYALSPRVLTTLTAISSEAWPVALVPWTLLPFLRARACEGTRARACPGTHACAGTIPVAFMGAVNATATVMACLPAGLLLVYRRQWKTLALWLAGCAAVSAWWIGPLLVLGRYSPPFTDYIESSAATTYWLNFAEILRGTTSWAPFVDTERTAGYLLVAEPVFVLATAAVAAVGMAGLAARSMPWRGYLVTLLALGVLLLGLGQGPLGTWWQSLLDDPLAPFRNVHKLDPLVRLPLVLGVGYVLSHVHHLRVKGPALTAVGLIVLAATAPAWSGRLAHQGTWEEVPEYWYEAAAFVDKHAPNTRTLVLPAASFARQDWGWTRDEPIQALSDTPFAVRDAIPLVDPEAIRGLDGLLATIEHDPERADEALRSFGIGAVLVRHDLEGSETDLELPGTPRSFGEIDVYLVEAGRDMMITTDKPVTVAGGGESLALLNALYGYAPRTLVGTDAHIVTDTPALAVRNYGTLDSAVSAHLRDLEEGDDIHNRAPDYWSEGTRVEVAETGGSARASSSAADASSFGGANASQSLTAAFDGTTRTSWWPQPGDSGWIESTVTGGEVTITATTTTTVRVISGDYDREISLSGYSPRTVRVPGETVRVELTEPVGIAELDTGVQRLVTVPDTSPNAQVFMFQRLMPATSTLQRGFTTGQADTWQLSGPATIDGEDYEAGPVELEAGFHVLESREEVLTLERGSAGREAPTAAWEPFNGTVSTVTGSDGSPVPQRILTTRSFNEGLRAHVGGYELLPQRIDAGMTSFVVPAGVSGEVTFSFAGQPAYRFSLVAGGTLGALTLLWCIWRVWVAARHPRSGVISACTPDSASSSPCPHGHNSWGIVLLPLATAVLVGGIPGAIGAAVAVIVTRWTVIPRWVLSGGAVAMMGLWLARAPWPTAGYAGDSVPVAVAGAVALVALVAPAPRSLARAAPPSTLASPQARRRCRTRRY